MASTNQKRIGKPSEKETVSLHDTLHDTWKVMKPFVHFSIKAMKVLAHTLIFIVKHIPKPEEPKPRPGSNRVIKL